MIEKEDIKLIEEITLNSEKEEVKTLNEKCKALLHLFELQDELQKVQEKLSNFKKESK